MSIPVKSMDFASLKRLGLEISGFAFYLYELYNFFHHPQVISIYDGSIEIYFLRFILLLLALPLLYLFRVAYFFDWGDALSYFLSGVFKFENANAFFQVKLFYYTIYILLSILLFLEAIDNIYRFFS